MGWLDRLTGRQPRKVTVQAHAGGLALAILQRTRTLAEFLDAEGVTSRLVMSRDAVVFQSVLFLAFPHYVAMGTAFAEHSERLRIAFVSALIAAAIGEENTPMLSPQERAEWEHEIIGTFNAYNTIWQTGGTGGETMRKLSAAALERITGSTSGSPPSIRVMNTLFTETKNVFMVSERLRREFEIIG